MYQLGDIVNDRYEVIGILSPLPLGPLYRAVQRKTNLHVFLWAIGPSVLPDQAARQSFIQQLTRSYGVRHPNALPLCDLFADRDRVVMALQYVEGPTIAAHVERRRADGTQLGRAEAWVAIEQVASACGQYHQLGLVVAALRPELVLMTGAGAMLFDPAVALALPRKRLLAALKRTGRWHYLAPEVRAGWPCDRRADVYSLAALAHLVLYAAPHGWDDGARRGLFARLGHRLRFGARPRMARERWPLVDQVLRRSLSGSARDRAPDIESFCLGLHQALSASPERVLPRPPAATVQAPSPGSAPPPGANARTVQAQVTSTPHVSAAPPPGASARTVQAQVTSAPHVSAAPPPAAPPPAAAPAENFDAPPTYLLPRTDAAPAPQAATAATPAEGFDAPPTFLLPRSGDAPTAIETPHARPANEFDAPRTIESAPVTDFDAPLTVEAPPPVIEMVALRTMEMFAADAPPPPVAAPVAPAAPAPAPALTAPTSSGGENATLQVNVAEIASLLAASEADDASKNKTREINSAEIEALLARSRLENPEK